MDMPTLLVTGSNGLIASKIIERFAAAGTWQVVATSRQAIRWQLPQGVRQELLDVCRPAELAYLLDVYRPDAVIHTAAVTKPDECERDAAACWEINTRGAQNVADACSQRQIYLIHFSTDFVFDGTQAFYGEDDELSPLSVYARSKAEADAYVEDVCSKYAIVRTSMVYGRYPGPGRSSLVSWVLDSLSAGKPIRVVCDQYRTPTLADDIAEGCLLLAQSGETGVFNLAGPDFMPVVEIARRTAQSFGLDSKLIAEAATIDLCEPARRPMRTFLRTDKARAVLGFEAHSLNEGLQILKQQLGWH